MSDNETNDLVARKILHALEVFPFISASMIHMAIGTSMPTSMWRPILEDLVDTGKIRTTTHSAKNTLDRQQAYTIYHLPTNEYTYGS